ncbi:hypothetical protein [Lactococcus sp.]
MTSAITFRTSGDEFSTDSSVTNFQTALSESFFPSATNCGSFLAT